MKKQRSGGHLTLLDYLCCATGYCTHFSIVPTVPTTGIIFTEDQRQTAPSSSLHSKDLAGDGCEPCLFVLQSLRFRMFAICGQQTTPAQGSFEDPMRYRL